MGHRPQQGERKLIVGVDPGITCGLAMIDLEGRPVALKSGKGLTREEVLKEISKWGEAVIVASDVAPAPEFVRKIAASLEAVIFTPSSVMSSFEKQAIVSQYANAQNFDCGNAHSRDALAAALKAFQSYRNKFQRLEAAAKRAGLRRGLDEAKAKVVHGQAIKRALASSPSKAERSPSLSRSQRSTGTDRSVLRERDQLIMKLESANRLLLEEVSSLKSKLNRLAEEVEARETFLKSELRRERAYEAQRLEILNLREELVKARETVKMQQERISLIQKLQSAGDMILLKPVKTFSQAGLQESIRGYSIKAGDAIMLLDASGGGSSTAQKLADLNPEIVVACTRMSHQAEEALRGRGVQFIQADEIHVEWVEDHPYASRPEIKRAIGISKARERNKTESRIEDALRDYRELRQD